MTFEEAENWEFNPFDLTNAISGAETVVHAASASKSRNSDVAIERDIEINLKGTVSIIQYSLRNTCIFIA